MFPRLGIVKVRMERFLCALGVAKVKPKCFNYNPIYYLNGRHGDNVSHDGDSIWHFCFSDNYVFLISMCFLNIAEHVHQAP